MKRRPRWLERYRTLCTFAVTSWAVVQLSLLISKLWGHLVVWSGDLLPTIPGLG